MEAPVYNDRSIDQTAGGLKLELYRSGHATYSMAPEKVKFAWLPRQNCL